MAGKVFECSQKELMKCDKLANKFKAQLGPETCDPLHLIQSSESVEFVSIMFEIPKTFVSL